MIAITTLSAYIRLSRTGLGCEPWPQCYAVEVLRAASLETGAIGAARLAHRVSASAVLVAIIAALMIALARNPPLRRQGRWVLWLLGLAAFLAAFGRATADSLLPAVTLGNLLAGLVMFAVACAFVRSTGGRELPASMDRHGPSSRPLRPGPGWRPPCCCCRSRWAAWSARPTPA